MASEYGVLGDYRIVREVGRGGMGVVYEAEQISLRRRVALKVLPFAAILDSRQLQRFQNEAQAAACLHHKNIVPVHAVGCARGVHYYAMQFIDGQSLAELIGELRQDAGLETDVGLTGPASGGRKPPDDGPPVAKSSSHQGADAPRSPQGERVAPSTLRGAAPSTERATQSPSYFRTVAQLGLQAAEALDHAHQQGVVHRDIKPANLLVDARGNLWITDFGLAHYPGQTALTRTGDLVGTFRYMSPEQALGKPGLVDARTDLYSLGATLYELLTLYPLLNSSDRQELLRRIAEEEPLAPRRLKKAIPVELETIVLKALAKTPAERYTTAAQMADDLRRFVEDRPILARRPGLVERAQRWARRHKAVVASAVVLLFMAVVALGVSTALIARHQRETEARRRQARRAVDEMYTEVAQKWLAHQPQLEPVQQEFLLKALRFYKEFAQETSDEPAVQLEAGKAYHRVGHIEHKLGHFEEAKDAYGQGLALLEELTERCPTEAAYRQELAACLADWGNWLRDSERFAEAEQVYRRALADFARLATAHPEEPTYWDGLAGSSNNLGIVLDELKRPAEAEKAYRDAVAILTRLTADDPDAPGYRHDLAQSRNNLANLLRNNGQFQKAQENYRAALALWSKLANDFPDRPAYRQTLASGYHSYGTLLLATGRLDKAEEAYRHALVLRTQLATDFAAVPVYRQAQAVTDNRLAYVLANTGRPQQAEQLYRQAVAVLDKLTADFPATAAYRLEWAASQNDFGAFLENTGRGQEAEEAYRRALAVAERIAADYAAIPEYRWLLAAVHKNMGGLFSATGRPAEAEQALRRALALEEKLVETCPAVPGYRAELAWLLAACAYPPLRDVNRAAELGGGTDARGRHLLEGPGGGSVPGGQVAPGTGRAGTRDETEQRYRPQRLVVSGDDPPAPGRASGSTPLVREGKSLDGKVSAQ